MSDLIRRQDAVSRMSDLLIMELQGKRLPTWNEVYQAMNDIPSAEPEQKIIHCKDCRFAHLTTKGEVKYCDVWFPEEKTYFSADNFCSFAEKRGE